MKMEYKLRSMPGEILLCFIQNTKRREKNMDKNDNEQVASPASIESPASPGDSHQHRLESMGEDGAFFAGRYL